MHDTLSGLQKVKISITENAGNSRLMLSQMAAMQNMLAHIPVADSVISETFQPDGFVGEAVTNVAKMIARLTETEAVEGKHAGKDILSFIGVSEDVEAAMALTRLTQRVISADIATIQAVGVSSNDLRQLQRRMARMSSAALRKATVAMIAGRAAKQGTLSANTIKKRALIAQSASITA